MQDRKSGRVRKRCVPRQQGGNTLGVWVACGLRALEVMNLNTGQGKRSTFVHMENNSIINE